LHRSNSVERQQQQHAQGAAATQAAVAGAASPAAGSKDQRTRLTPALSAPAPSATTVLGQRPVAFKGAGSVTVTVTAPGGASVGGVNGKLGTGLQPRLGPTPSPSSAVATAAKPGAPLARPASPLARSQQQSLAQPQRPPSPGHTSSNVSTAAAGMAAAAKRPALIKATGATATGVASPAAAVDRKGADGSVVVPRGTVKARMPGRQPLTNTSPQPAPPAASVSSS
jgi:hypothetical protein